MRPLDFITRFYNRLYSISYRFSEGPPKCAPPKLHFHARDIIGQSTYQSMPLTFDVRQDELPCSGFDGTHKSDNRIQSTWSWLGSLARRSRSVPWHANVTQFFWSIGAAVTMSLRDDGFEFSARVSPAPSDRAPEKMVFIPGGTFVMGSDHHYPRGGGPSIGSRSMVSGSARRQ